MTSTNAVFADAAVYATVGGRTRADQVADRISMAISAGVIESGERLPTEAAIGQLFSVSTATAREALSRLREDGLVTTTRGRTGGSFVTDHPALRQQRLEQAVANHPRVDITDLCVQFAAISAGAARHVARMHAADDLDQLRRLNEADPADHGAWCRAENAFHLQLAATTQSARLTRTVIASLADFAPLLWASLRDAEDRRDCQREHEQILAAIERGDQELAARASEAHIMARRSWLLAEHRRLRARKS